VSCFLGGSSLFCLYAFRKKACEKLWPSDWYDQCLKKTVAISSGFETIVLGLLFWIQCMCVDLWIPQNCIILRQIMSGFESVEILDVSAWILSFLLSRNSRLSWALVFLNVLGRTGIFSYWMLSMLGFCWLLSRLDFYSTTGRYIDFMEVGFGEYYDRRYLILFCLCCCVLCLC